MYVCLLSHSSTSIHVLKTNATHTNQTKSSQQTDVAFLERDIKNRKHTFGIQIYEILQSNAKSSSTSDTVFSASDDIQTAFEECKLDVETLEKKIEKKREEMVNIGDGQQQQQPQQQQPHDEGGGGDGESVSGRNAELESGILPGYWDGENEWSDG